MYPDDAASPVNTHSGSTPDGAGDFSANKDSCCISVKSLWKVFGKNSDKVLSPEYEGKDKADILAELGCVVALQDASFDVGRGETFVVMGLSGSGKSTLVRCLIRLIEPTSGRIFIDGQDILEYDDAQLTDIRRNKVAMVFQHYGLLPHRRVIDNAAWGLELRGVDQSSRYARTQEVLDLVGLTGWEQAYPRELSGGMQQRVGLARALAVDPDILLMDEPFSGLDPLIRREMQDELVRLQRELHKTIVFITHDLDEALKIGDRIAIMRDGKIVQIGTPEAIVLNPANEYVAEFTRDVRRESILKVSGVMVAPGLVFSAGQTPETAVEALESRGAAAAWVVDTNNRYLGVLTLAQGRRAAQAGAGGLSEFLDPAATPVSSDTSFEELIPRSMASDLPIPVVSSEGALVGEVHRSALVTALSGSS